MSNEWIAEGVSTRSRPGHPNPVVHLVVLSEGALWCTGSPGRAVSVHHTTPDGRKVRTCNKCRDLAYDAWCEDTASADELGRFAPVTPGRRMRAIFKDAESGETCRVRVIDYDEKAATAEFDDPNKGPVEVIVGRDDLVFMTTVDGGNDR